MRFFKSSAERAAEKAEGHLREGRFPKAAELFSKAGRHADAAAIYEEHLGDVDRAAEAWEKADEPARAGELLFAAGRHRDAVSRFQAAGLPRRAAEACVESGQAVRAGGFFEQAGLFDRAADCYVDGGEVERALDALEKEVESLRQRSDAHPSPGLEQRLAQLDQRRLDLFGKLERHLDAARLLLERGEPARAAPLFEKAEDPASAASAYLEAEQEAEALRLAEVHGDELPAELRAQILLENARHAEAAAIFEHLEKYDAAASALEEAGEPVGAAALWHKIGSHSKAARLYSENDRPYDAARSFARAGRDLAAAEHFERAGALRNAADAYLNAEPPQPLRAGELYLEAGFEPEALEVLRSIRPGSVDYAPASLLLVLPLLATGDTDSVASRMRYLQERRDQLDRRQVREFSYLLGRLLETKKQRKQLERAAAAYRAVIAEDPDHRDAPSRLEKVKRRLEVETGERPAEPEDDLDASGLTRYLASHPHATQRLVMKPSHAATGSVPQEELKARAREIARQSEGTDTGSYEMVSDIDLEIRERISPWWDGADFLRVRDPESGEPKLMVSFPLALIGERADSFEYILRQLQLLDHDVILQLERHLTASDKVMLVYEDFDGVPLADELADSEHPRDFAPRSALHILLQLCEALESAHKLGLTHQWLSLRTVLINRRNRCKIVGLGLREFLAASDASSRAYISPEVAENAPAIGFTSDVYSLGLLAMQLLEVQKPVDWRENLDPERFGWPRLVAAEIPTSLRSFLVRCLHRNPLDRPTTSELATALTSIGLAAGQRLASRYEVIQEIGRGGMSKVYKARDLELEGEVAIKTLLSPAFGRPEDEQRLYREAQISRRISHPNVVRVHDIGRFPGGIFIIMELLEGPGLDEVIREDAPLSRPRVKHILTEVASALAEAHRLSIVHRDLKPGNVILVDGRAKVLDFGIARMTDDSPNPHLTRTGEVIGSPLYMSPEQIQGKEIDGRSDLYSLGVIGYTLLCGREPFAADSPTEVVLKHMNEAPPDLRRHIPDLEDEWIHLIERLLRKLPSERYASAEELLESLAGLPG